MISVVSSDLPILFLCFGPSPIFAKFIGTDEVMTKQAKPLPFFWQRLNRMSLRRFTLFPIVFGLIAGDTEV